MKKLLAIFMALGFGCILAGPAQSAIINLYEYNFNATGTIDSSPSGLNASGFDFTTGLGSITWTSGIAGAGGDAGYLLGFFDHEIDEATNTFFNEYGAPVNSPSASQSWEIDEPGYGLGDIWDNFSSGSLDNNNGVPSGSEDDVSMAMGWHYTLNEGERAIITLLLSETAPTSGFYLKQTDPDSNIDIYFSSTFRTEGGGTPVPEPGTLLLVSIGLATFVIWKKRGTK